MCDSVDNNPLPVETKPAPQKICGKCRTAVPSVYVRRSFYCRPCFNDSVIHRFRTVLQRKDLLPDDLSVLLAYSGGPSSSTMLHLIKDFHSQNGRKKQKFKSISVCHIDESILGYQTPEDIQKITAAVSDSGLNLTCIKLEDCFTGTETEKSQKFNGMMELVSDNSAREDLVFNIKIDLLLREARRTICKGLLMGCNATRLAIRIISQTSKGRGFALPIDIATETDYYKDVVVLRPMKEILSKEVGLYNHYNNVKFAAIKNAATGKSKHSIDRLTEDFITSLQIDFPSTVNTVCKTMQKVTTDYKSSTISCILCSGPVQLDSHKWGDFHTISSLPQVTGSETIKSETAENNSGADDMRSLICYSCQRLKGIVKTGMDLPVFVRDQMKSVSKGLERDERMEKVAGSD
ncbi:Cytoplasmic tRNA 2-thiolation protein 2 [Nowakowskiella sp. JEL0407]|nr:Cytoplasmic tRNA 2-thiolation protein 2 [Nowakowskiella sp. JEL0407]